MNWNDLKKCKADDIVGYINEQLADNSLNKVASNLGVCESTIRRNLERKGYKRIENEFVQKDDMCNHRKHTQEKEQMTTENTDVINMPDIKKNMMYLSNETETLKDIIKWFKSKDDKSNTSVIEVVDGIRIDLPEANIKRTTIRINEKIWDMFNELVEENKPMDKHDLMGMALLEYINKYKK